MSDLILKEIESLQKEGIDCKYEDSYLLIEQEVDKDYSVTQDATDWAFVYTNTQELLETKTKDLKLAVWWLFSSWKNNLWNKLEKDLTIFISFIELYSKDLYPKSKKGKINIIDWLENSLINEIANNDVNKKSLIKPILFYELFLKLDLIVKEMLDDSNNRFKKIIELLRPYYEDEQKKLKDSELKDSVKDVISHSSSVVLYEVDELSTESDAIKLLSSMKKNFSKLGSYYRKNDFADLRAIRICRVLSWFETDGLPYADGKRTHLHPPAELELDELNSLYSQEKYEEALILAEEIIEVSPFWIDGHFLVYNIFDKTDNKNVANEIKNTILSFVKTNEGILDFHFTDNTPFASQRVKKWIKEELEVKSEGKETNNSTEIMEKTYDLANSGKIKLAMEKIAEEYSKSSSMEDKFNWRLHHAQLAVEFNKKSIALALLEDLQKDIDRFNLDEWNPSLVSRVYTLILNTFTNIDIHADKLEETYKKLCKADINSAFEIELN